MQKLVNIFNLWFGLAVGGFFVGLSLGLLLTT